MHSLVTIMVWLEAEDACNVAHLVTHCCTDVLKVHKAENEGAVGMHEAGKLWHGYMQWWVGSEAVSDGGEGDEGLQHTV